MSVGSTSMIERAKTALLTVLFGQSDGHGFRFEILFGSESVWVPRELQIVLARALELTVAMVAGNEINRGTSQKAVLEDAAC